MLTTTSTILKPTLHNTKYIINAQSQNKLVKIINALVKKSHVTTCSRQLKMSFVTILVTKINKNNKK
jgi:hypothetical protein